MNSEQSLPLEKRLIKVDVNGESKMVPGLDKTWVDVINRKFSSYITHPVLVNGEFLVGEKETWLELTRYVVEDLEWLLQQKHHVFWSHMIYSKDAHRLLITFLQEAPPYYLRDDFPKDDEMEELLSRVEYLVFLVLVRLSTEKESENRFIQNLGELLYENYIFTVPIFLDICLVYGIRNRNLVSKMFNDVLSVAPQYLDDFKEVVPHFMHILTVVKIKLENNEMSLVNDISKLKEMRDVILHLYDSCANIQIFLDIHSNSSNLFRLESFASEVSSFYTYVIPKMYKFIKRSTCNLLNGPNFLEKIDEIRLNLISIVRNAFCSIVNDVLNEEESKLNYANEYLTKIMEILQGPDFLIDYNKIYPIDADLTMLNDLCREIDSENFNYISQAISSLKERPQIKKTWPEIDLDSHIAKVKDILPHLGNDFIEHCLELNDFDTEKVLAGILEGSLPPDVEKSDESKAIDKAIPKNKETLDLFNDKSEVNLIRDKISSFVLADDYDDEYDDTYDDKDIAVREAGDADQERRPFVTPMILRRREDDEESEEEPDEEEPIKQIKPRDCFLPNPAEIRARQEQGRIEAGRRVYVGKRKGQGQDKQVLINRDYKDAHKSYMANHNRRRLQKEKYFL